MRFSRLSFVLAVALLVGALASGFLSTGGLANLAGLKASAQPTPAHPVVGPQPFPDAYKIQPAGLPNIAVPGATDGLTHPCGGMSPTPPYTGVSPLSIAYVPNMCSSGYGDIAVWQANGHSYVAQSGFALRMYHIWNVDDPYNPVILITKPFPSGGTASTAIFHFRQYGHEYLATTMRGSGIGCGYFIDNVDNPAVPVPVVTNKSGADWCTVHETFVSTNANGDADYAWLSMSGESGSGYKEVVLTLPNLSQSNVLTETGRYQRPDSVGGSGGIFIHDSNVVGDRVYLAHWAGGVVVQDKQTLANNIQPAPLSIDGIRPMNFWVHHMVPTSDNKFVVLQDEFINSPSLEKIKLYNIENLATPFYAGGIIGGDTESNRSQSHNLIIKNLGPNHDLLLSAFYLAGYRLYDLDTSGSTPVIAQVGSHQLRAVGGGNFGGVWGVDQLPCTVRGVQTTCIYSSDMKYGLVVDALGVNPAFDPYLPDPSVITSPTEGQQIDTCTFTIQGTAPQDYWSGLARIEVSTDNGLTWNIATGTTSWSYQWDISGTGPFTIKVRAVDNAGNIQLNPTTVNVNVTANCPLTTPTAGPSNTAVPSNTPVPPTSTSVPPTATRTRTSTPQASATLPCAGSGDSPLCTPTAIATALSPTATATATATACTISFSDVPVGSTFYTYIQCLACRGVINGYPDGTFLPNNNVTRGQLAKIVSQAARLTDPAGAQIFEDVAPASTFYVYVQRLASRGYMSGYVCGGAGEPCGVGNKPYFRPANNATRGQISKIVANAAGFTRIPAGGQTFEDVPPSHTFYQYIESLAGRGIMSGYACGGTGEPCGIGNRPYFRPASNATRGQTSKIVANTFFPECSPTR